MVAEGRDHTEKLALRLVFDHEVVIRELGELHFHVEGDERQDIQLQLPGFPGEPAGLIALGPEARKNQHGEGAQLLQFFVAEELRLHASDSGH